MTAARMRIDHYMPRYDVAEFHQRVIQAEPQRVYAAIWQADLAASAPVKALLALRMLPSLFSRKGKIARSTHVHLQDVLRAGFVLLEEERDREVVIGVSGRFWWPIDNLLPTDPRTFRDPLPAGTARAAWNFAVAPHADGTLLTTETRVLCADAAALRSFRRYWRLVGPFSGLIRIAMLRAIAAAAQPTAE